MLCSPVKGWIALNCINVNQNVKNLACSSSRNGDRRQMGESEA